jgi:hypothetical protein
MWQLYRPNSSQRWLAGILQGATASAIRVVECKNMRDAPSVALVVSSLLLISVGGGGVQAQTIQFTVKDVALKNGESTELGDVFAITTNCKSLLKGTPEVEILDGPPGVSAAINPAKVVPRGLGCANPVPGGKLVITAKDIQEHSYTRMVLRINYKTLNGDRQRSENINISLFPNN